MSWTLTPFQSRGSISHASSTRIVNIHEISKIAEQLSLCLVYIKALHSTNGVVLLAVVVAREYIQDMLVVNSTAVDLSSIMECCCYFVLRHAFS